MANFLLFLTMYQLHSYDYYPFGSPMPERSFSSPSYRYGFNGMEKDDEVKGLNGASYDFGARMYDSRLGRFMSVDPDWKMYKSQSTYNFAQNSPIIAIDYNGKGFTITVNSPYYGNEIALTLSQSNKSKEKLAKEVYTLIHDNMPPNFTKEGAGWAKKQIPDVTISDDLASSQTFKDNKAENLVTVRYFANGEWQQTEITIENNKGTDYPEWQKRLMKKVIHGKTRPITVFEKLGKVKRKLFKIYDKIIGLFPWVATTPEGGNTDGNTVTESDDYDDPNVPKGDPNFVPESSDENPNGIQDTTYDQEKYDYSKKNGHTKRRVITNGSGDTLKTEKVNVK